MPGKSSKKRNASKKKKTKPHTRVLARSKPAAAAPKIPEETKVANVPPLLDLDLSRAALERLRVHYTLMGKEDWWWIFDDSLKEIARQLLIQDFVVLDGFVPDELHMQIKRELKVMYDSGSMRIGLLAGGRTGTNMKYAMGSVRGDHVVWVDGAQKGQENLHKYLQRVDTCVSELSTFLPELKTITNRSEAMCTCYPGNGARYTRHCDNPNQNGRKLTALLYLNEEWEEGHGGELRACHPPPYDNHSKAVLPPLAGRLVLFWSDKRVPHEVLPASVHRYAVTVWYFDGEEKARADEFARKAATSAEEKEGFLKEDERIRAEIQKFEAQAGAADSATIVSTGQITDVAYNSDTNVVDQAHSTSESQQSPPSTVLDVDSDDELPDGAYRQFTPAQRDHLMAMSNAQTPSSDAAAATEESATVDAALQERLEQTLKQSAHLNSQRAREEEQQRKLRQEFGEQRITQWRREHEAFLAGESDEVARQPAREAPERDEAGEGTPQTTPTQDGGESARSQVPEPEQDDESQSNERDLPSPLLNGETDLFALD